MTEPHYHITETADGLYEIHASGAPVPIATMDTVDEAIAWVENIEGAHVDQSEFRSPDDDHW